MSPLGCVPHTFLLGRKNLTRNGVDMNFLNTPEDCQWLRDVHLGGRTDIMFASYVLYGNEDCPIKVELYADQDPLVTDEPHTITFL